MAEGRKRIAHHAVGDERVAARLHAYRVESSMSDFRIHDPRITAAKHPHGTAHPLSARIQYLDMLQFKRSAIVHVKAKPIAGLRNCLVAIAVRVAAMLIVLYRREYARR